MYLFCTNVSEITDEQFAQECNILLHLKNGCRGAQDGGMNVCSGGQF